MTSADPSSFASVPAKVLLVDDFEDALLSTRLLLQRPGLQVLTANCAAQALELLAQHEVALALLDVQMPVVNGYELAERMRGSEHTRSVPIIFMTGNGTDPARSFLGYEAGAVDFLIKPVDARVLESKVQVFVELDRLRRELRERNAELERRLQRNEAMAQALRKAHGEAVQEAHTDALTGVSNRRHILLLGEAGLRDRRRQTQPLSLAVLDLDHFKLINDRFGHQTGDVVLRAFCDHVVQQVRPDQQLGRLGGEEFLLLMPGTPVADAEVVMERVRQTLKPHAGVHYTFSAGMAQVEAGETLSDAINRADNALYEAKRSGRDCSFTSPAPL